MNKLMITVLVAGLLVFGAAGTAIGAPTGPTSKPVFRVTDPTFQSAIYWDRTPIAGARSSLLRQASGLKMNMVTSLAPEHDVTMWLFVFNHPENCEHGTELGHCGPGDLAPFGGDASVETSLVYGTGHPVGGSGRAAFGSTLSTNDATQAVFGPGVTNPLGAEIHLGLRDCDPECVFVQFSAFPAN